MKNKNNNVLLAKRINNSKRGYLIINKNQGKHRAALIKDVMKEYNALALKVKEYLGNETALIIGFAETAIAIGASVASFNNAPLMQTTREDIFGVEYIHFIEAHSHAREQKLIKNDLESIYDKVNKIVFIEDEITTGSTILHCIDEIEKIFKGGKQYAVAALLSSLSKERREVFSSRGVDVLSLETVDHADFEERVKTMSDDGKIYHLYKKYAAEETFVYDTASVKEFIFNTCVQTRRLLEIGELDSEIVRLKDELEERLSLSRLLETAGYVSVVGTEEFVYVPVKLAEYMDGISGKNTEVYTHSATRSPISVSKEANYPLHVRYEVGSLYDSDRQTYIYDLVKSDILFLVTDGKKNAGYESVMEAIRLSGNENVYMIRWSNEQQLQK